MSDRELSVMPETAPAEQVLTGDDLIAQFESGKTPATSFHHADHVRLAFEYLRRYSILEAIERFCRGLKRSAAAQGKASLYHETITWAYLLLIRERSLRTETTDDWEVFSQRNPDLLVWKGGVMDQLYTKATLDSEIARRIFVMPDRTKAF